MSEPTAPTAVHRLLQGATNFRDAGGWRAADGARVRTGRLFRSDHLAGLTAQDTQQVQALGLRHSIDLRGAQERAQTPYAVPGVRQVALGIEPTVVTRLRQWHAAGQVPSVDDTVAVMCQTYRDFARLHGPVFGQVVRQLLADPVPQVIHCTSGKDRTGFAVAMVLWALGVSDDDIAHDYLLTNAYYQAPSEMAGSLPAEVRQVLWTVRPQFLQAALETVNTQFGGRQAYWHGAMGLGQAEQDALRAALLT